MDFHLGYEIAYPISFIVYIFTEFFKMFLVFSFFMKYFLPGFYLGVKTLKPFCVHACGISIKNHGSNSSPKLADNLSRIEMKH